MYEHDQLPHVHIQYYYDNYHIIVLLDMDMWQLSIVGFGLFRSLKSCKLPK